MALKRLAFSDLSLSYTRELVMNYQALQQKLMELQDLVGEGLVDALFPASEQWADTFRSLAATINGDDFDAETLREVLRTGIT